MAWSTDTSLTDEGRSRADSRFKSGSFDTSAWSRRFSSASSTDPGERLRLGLQASRHVQVLISHRTGSSGREEQGHAIRGDERLRVVLRTVHPGTEIHWRGPWVGRAAPGRDPHVGEPDSSDPVREEEQLESIGANGWALIVGRTAQLRHRFGRPPGSVRLPGADVNVVTTQSAGPVTPEKQERHAEVVIREVARARIVGRRIDRRPEIDGRLPGEVIMDLLAMRDPDVKAAETTGSSDAVEEHPVTIARELGDRLEDCRVNRRAEIHGWSPGVVDARSLRHPDVRTAEPAVAKRPGV